MVNPIYDILNEPDLAIITLLKEAMRAVEQTDDIRSKKIREMFEDAKRLDVLPSLIHPKKIEAATVWKFAYRSSLAAAANRDLNDGEEQDTPLRLRNVEAARHADLTTILVKCQKSPVGIFLSAIGRDEDGRREVDEEDQYDEEEESDEDDPL